MSRDPSARRPEIPLSALEAGIHMNRFGCRQGVGFCRPARPSGNAPRCCSACGGNRPPADIAASTESDCEGPHCRRRPIPSWVSTELENAHRVTAFNASELPFASARMRASLSQLQLLLVSDIRTERWRGRLYPAIFTPVTHTVKGNWWHFIQVLQAGGQVRFNGR